MAFFVGPRIAPRIIRFAILTILAAALGIAVMGAVSPVSLQAAEVSPRLADHYGRLPLTFEANQGQTDARVRFLSRGQGHTLFLTESEAVLFLPGKTQADGREESSVLRLQLVDANHSPQISAENPVVTRSNYFIGNDPTQWRTNVPSYGRIRYRQVYPGIDLIHYGNQRRFEHDFVVAPGADPGRISFRLRGATGLRLESSGDLLVTTETGQLRLQKPQIYQEEGGVRRAVKGSYRLLADNRVAFRIGEFDRRKALVIDPVLVYSTYLGGSGDTTYSPAYLGGDSGYAIAVNSAGNAYVTGVTKSADFPTASPMQSTNRGPKGIGNAFISKLSADGSTLLFSTYLGGSGTVGKGIALDASGNVYVTGYTLPTNFPLVNPLQTSTGLGGQLAFVTKLSADGSSLVYSTYLGGGYQESGNAIAVDGSGAAYVTGQAGTGFPSLGSLGCSISGGSNAPFVAKVKADGSSLLYSACLGSSGGSGAGIAVDGSGNAYVTGSTSSASFPTVNALQSVLAEDYSAFVAKVNSTGSALIYSTYLGGSGTYPESSTTLGNAIAVDSSGNAYITGQAGKNFPSTGGLGCANSNGKAFVAELAASGSSLIYSMCPSSGGSTGQGIALDSSGNAYITGYTSSTDFPTVNPVQSELGGNQSAPANAFVAKLNAGASVLIYSTYLGGSGYHFTWGGGDMGRGIAVDPSGSAYVTGVTYSTDFPTVNPYQSQLRTYVGNAFVAKLSSSQNQAARPAFAQAPGTYTGSVTVSITDATPGVTIYYTTDGSTPTTSSAQYSGALQITQTTTLKAMAASSSYLPSLIATGTYTIQTGVPSAAPTVTGLNPPMAIAGTGDFTLTVTGTNFMDPWYYNGGTTLVNSVLYWNGSARPTTFVSGTQLTAKITAADIASVGTADVTIVNPAPSGGSVAFKFAINSSAMSAASQNSSVDVQPGQSVTVPVTFTGADTASQITANCVNLPSGASCSYDTTAKAVTIQTTANTLAGTYQILIIFTFTQQSAALAHPRLLLASGLGTIGIPLGLLWIGGGRKRVRLAIGLFVLGLMLSLAACSGGGSGSGSATSSGDTAGSGGGARTAATSQAAVSLSLSVRH